MKIFEVNPKLEKITNVRLPFDRRHDDPHKNYGIHGLDVWFILKGEKGAVQFAVAFPAYLPHIDVSSFSYKPQIVGFDVGYHAKEPQFEGHTSMECRLFNDKCYYDGSSLLAEDWVKEIFSIVGEPPENRLWEKLQNKYIERFGEP